MVQTCLLIIFGQTVFLFLQQLAKSAWPYALLFWGLVHLVLLWSLLEKCQCWDTPSMGLLLCSLRRVGHGQYRFCQDPSGLCVGVGFSYGWFVGNLELIYQRKVKGKSIQTCLMWKESVFRLCAECHRNDLEITSLLQLPSFGGVGAGSGQSRCQRDGWSSVIWWDAAGVNWKDAFPPVSYSFLNFLSANVPPKTPKGFSLLTSFWEEAP